MPAATALASEAYAAELIELYWASLLRDTAFTGYPGDAVAARAAAELSSLPPYAGPRDPAGRVTPELLFRGGFAGETAGPYLSQFLLQPTALGSLPVPQRYVPNQPGVDFMTRPAEFLDVQNGRPTGKSLTPGDPLYLHDGRGLAAYTHDDVLYQAYFIAYLVLDTPRHPAESWQPLRQVQDAERLRHPRPARYRLDPGHGRRRGAPGSLVPEVVGPPAAPPGIGWGDRSPVQDRAGRQCRRPRQRHRTYNEHFSVQLTKLDGTVATIANG